jgi:hypothetical protein
MQIPQLRHRLWVTRLQRTLTQLAAAQLYETSGHLRIETHRVRDRAKVLQRRSRWLCRTRRQLPRLVGPGR